MDTTLKQSELKREFKFEDGKLWKLKKKKSGDSWVIVQCNTAMFNGVMINITRLIYCLVHGDLVEGDAVYRVDKTKSLYDVDNLILINSKKKRGFI